MNLISNFPSHFFQFIFNITLPSTPTVSGPVLHVFPLFTSLYCLSHAPLISFSSISHPNPMQSEAQITSPLLSSFPSLLPLLPFVLNALWSLNSIAVRSCLIPEFRVHQQKPEPEASNCRLEDFARKPLDMRRLVVLHMLNFYSAFCTVNSADHYSSKFCDSHDVLFHKTSCLSRVLFLHVLIKERHLQSDYIFCRHFSIISYIVFHYPLNIILFCSLLRRLHSSFFYNTRCSQYCNPRAIYVQFSC